MSKFSGRIGQSAGLAAELEKVGQVELPAGPTETAPEIPQAPAQDPQVLQDPSQNLQVAEELPAQAPEIAPLAPDQQLEADLAEQQRQSLPDLRERWKAQQMPDPILSATSSIKPDGGIIDRANKMASAAEQGGLRLPVELGGVAGNVGFMAAKEGKSSYEIAESIAAEQEGSVQAAIARAGGVTYDANARPQVDPDFMKAGSIVTENMIFQLAGGAERDILPGSEIDPETGEAPAPTPGRRAPTAVAKQQGNAAIGQQIAQEYQRLKGKEVPEKIPTKEAESLGDAFKMMWAAQNPNLAFVDRGKGKDQQKYIFLTPEGENVMAQGKADRSKLFPTANVKPAKTPLRQGQLPGDVGQNIVKRVQGKVGPQKFGDSIENAMKNLAQVPNVVDKQRMKILYATALPVLQHSQNPKAFDTWQAKINNIGQDKVAKYTAANAGNTEIAYQEMAKASQKLANEIRSIAQERNGANFLSYAVQGFQGRISPQQRWFNPTTSKAVRFVTRNAVPSPAKPGSRVDYNLRQMYTMMLIKGGDGLLPEAREIKFESESQKLEQWGDRLQQAMEMTDAEAEAISQAIEQGIPLTDPNFPEVKPLKLDPEKDAELISAIESKGEDGPHFIDGVIDASKYLKARKAGKPYHSYFNAYIDGKTNGIASNGIQMGISETGKRTGVLRQSKTDYLDEGDIRDQLKSDLLRLIDESGFDGAHSDYTSELNAVARAVFSHRDLNKKTTMTFGYGKEVNTFGQDMYDTAQLLKADPSLIKDDRQRAAFLASIGEVESRLEDPKKFGDTLMTLYGPALEGVMSPEALAARATMRSAAVLHAATNQLMSITGPTGMTMNFGREVNLEGEYDQTGYALRGDKFEGGKQKFTAIHQKREATSAAARTYSQEDDAGNQILTEQAGDFAYGGSVVGPVQALDAATVALTASGKSWQRMKAASGNNPYMHTIYDAFKADAMGFDVVLDEVNHNWLKKSMDWSYLKETFDSTKEKMADWKAEINKRDPKEELSANERAYMDFILKPETNAKGKSVMKNYLKKIGTAGDFKRRGLDTGKMMEEMSVEMKKVGYDWRDPPDNPNVQQLKTFVSTLQRQMDSGRRFQSAISQTEANKKELKKEIERDGYQPKYGKHGKIALQYYAH